jgi:hypothetical protein
MWVKLILCQKIQLLRVKHLAVPANRRFDLCVGFEYSGYGHPLARLYPLGMLIQYMVEKHGVSQRQACKTVSVARSSYQYSPKPKNDIPVITELQELMMDGNEVLNLNLRLTRIILDLKARSPSLSPANVETEFNKDEGTSFNHTRNKTVLEYRKPPLLYLFGQNIRRPVLAAQHPGGLLIPDDDLFIRVKVNRSPQAIGNIGQVNQCA